MNNSKLVDTIYLVLGIISIFYYIALVAYGGQVSFSSFWVILGTVLIGFSIINFKDNKIRKVLSTWPLKSIKYIFILGIIFFIIIEGIIIWNGSKQNEEKSDYLVILGAGLKGERMSQSLYERMIKSLHYIDEHPKIKIVVSGGQGPGEDIPEAEAMKRFLLSHGVSQDRVITEENSTSTFENFKYTKQKLETIDKRNNIKITIITNNFHMYRSKMLARRQGFIAYGAPASLHPLLVPNYYVRESLALIKSYIFDRNQS